MKKRFAPFILLICSMALAACDTTPPAVSTLMQQVTKASQDASADELRACYARDGVTATQIDQQVGGWEEYFEKDQKWTFSSISYVSLADAPNNKSILPDTIAMAQGTTISGMKFEPNLKVVGFILVTFRQPGGAEGGETEPVGIAPDGTAKIVLVEPRS